MMLLGLAVTEHCNLRCPHCIRDDVTTFRLLEADFIRRVVVEAQELFGSVGVSLTGGEPLLHPELAELAGFFHARRVPWRFVSNGWHMKRLVPVLDRHPPSQVRLSLSGADEAVHDLERGRGSFRRVLTAVALLTSRRIPTWLSLVVDRRDRDQLREAVELADGLGLSGISFILPQPTVGGASRDSDPSPEESVEIVREIRGLAAEPGRRTRVGLDYGYPFPGEELPCQTFALQRIYVDTHGRLCTCCQLSNYGFNEAEVVADLRTVSLREAWPRYRHRLEELRAAQAPRPNSGDPMEAFPCLRCARSCGKLRWLEAHPGTAWNPLPLLQVG